jgi:predicted nucleic acid-binding protein
MRYLIDANVLSEATRRSPDAGVVGWLEAHETELVINAVVLAELAVGVAVLPEGRKRSRLESWFESLTDTIECVPWDGATGLEWARLVAALRRRGKTMPLFDSMIAATAHKHGLIIVTRNIRDFEPSGVELLNPFSDGGKTAAVHETDRGFGS